MPDSADLVDMSSIAWRGLNGPVRISEVCPPAPPGLGIEQPVEGVAREVVPPQAGSYAWPAVELRHERRPRRIVRREIGGGTAVEPALDLTATAASGCTAMPATPDPYVTGTPMQFEGRSLLEMHPAADPTADIEFLPVLRRLTVWSPVPPGNHGCELHRESAHPVPAALVERELPCELRPVEPEDGRPVERMAIPIAFEASVPGRTRSRPVSSNCPPKRVEPQIRILGHVIRFEFPSLH